MVDLDSLDSGDNSSEQGSTSSQSVDSSSSSDSIKSAIQAFEIEDMIEKIGFGRYQILLFVASGVVWGSDAMEVLCLSFLSPELERVWNSTDIEITMLVSVVFLGMLFGCFFFGYLSDRLGRKPTYLITSGILIFAGAMSASSINIYMLMCCRFLIGFGEGGAPVAFSMFSEFLPMRVRGRVLNLFEFWWTFGGIFESIIAWFVLSVVFKGSPYGWRVLLVITFFPLFVPLIMFFFIYESPRFLLAHGKTAKAKRNLIIAANRNKKELPEDFLLKEVPKASSWIGALKMHIEDYLHIHVIKNAVFLAIVWMSQSFCYYVLVQITPLLFTKIEGLNLEVDPYLMTIFSSASEAPGLIVSYLLVDRLGRKMTESVLFTVAALAAFSINFVETISFYTNRILVAVILVLLSSISRGAVMGAFCTSYTQTSEVFSTRIRGSMLGSMSSLSRISGMLSPILSYIVFSKFTYHYPVTVVSFICLLAALFSLFTTETHKVAMQDG